MTETATATMPRHPWFRRIVRSLILLAIFLAAAGFLYQNISESRDRRFNPMPGQLVEAGGFRMHIDCAGQGSPAVILDSGLGDTYVTWRKVQPQIAEFTRVCSYDRAGIGYSDSSSRPRTSQVIAEELHALLHSAGIAPPYVLVGHSMGGYDVRLYASLYPTEAAGMVLVDSSHPDQEKRLPAALLDRQRSSVRQAEFLEVTMPFGLPRLLGLCGADPVARAAECNLNTLRESIAEMKAFPESAAQTAATSSLGDMPLAVLSHDPDKPIAELPPDVAKPANDAWEKMQEELAHLSSRGLQTIARNSSHYIQIDRPEVVLGAVHAVVDQVRTPQSQSPSPSPSKP